VIPENIDRAFRRIESTGDHTGYLRLMTDIRLVLDWAQEQHPQAPKANVGPDYAVWKDEGRALAAGWWLRNGLTLGSLLSMKLGELVTQDLIKLVFSNLRTAVEARRAHDKAQ
jgi:hypothetical protein